MTSKVVHFYPVHDNELFKYQKVYDNPVRSNPLFEIDEFNENSYFQKDKLENEVSIHDIEFIH
ncbi:MAG: hypothetical protein IPP27_02290 [Bacteroidetes bacterium]|nr:hypothetical protein [Bacteroidota bacterium]